MPVRPFGPLIGREIQPVIVLLGFGIVPIKFLDGGLAVQEILMMPPLSVLRDIPSDTAQRRNIGLGENLNAEAKGRPAY
jgi:hypothetical protein